MTIIGMRGRRPLSATAANQQQLSELLWRQKEVPKATAACVEERKEEKVSMVSILYINWYNIVTW